jgi:hypothetical protein
MPALIIYEPHRATRVFVLRRTESLVGGGLLNDEAIQSEADKANFHWSLRRRARMW